MTTDLEKLAICRCPMDIMKPTGRFRPTPQRTGMYVFVNKLYEFECSFCGRKHWRLGK